MRNAQQSQRKLLDDLGEISNRLDKLEDACLATSEKVSNIDDLDCASDLKAEAEVSYGSQLLAVFSQVKIEKY